MKRQLIVLVALVLCLAAQAQTKEYLSINVYCTGKEVELITSTEDSLPKINKFSLNYQEQGRMIVNVIDKYALDGWRLVSNSLGYFGHPVHTVHRELYLERDRKEKRE